MPRALLQAVHSRDARVELLTRLRTACQQVTDERTSGTIATGHAELDAALPGGGWPCGAITELMPETAGIGELSLVLPALAQLARAGKYLAWIAPPYVPYPQALVQRGLALEQLLLIRTADTTATLWAAEQLLRCTHIGAVLAWPAALDDRQVRRLQLAAEAGGGCGLIYRPGSAAAASSPAALRLRLQAAPRGLVIHIQKSRGGFPSAVVVHPVSQAAA
jgi:cell division inhibitor SulA/protein ImuA